MWGTFSATMFGRGMPVLRSCLVVVLLSRVSRSLLVLSGAAWAANVLLLFMLLLRQRYLAAGADMLLCCW